MVGIYYETFTEVNLTGIEIVMVLYKATGGKSHFMLLKLTS